MEGDILDALEEFCAFAPGYTGQDVQVEMWGVTVWTSWREQCCTHGVDRPGATGAIEMVCRGHAAGQVGRRFPEEESHVQR